MSLFNTDRLSVRRDVFGIKAEVDFVVRDELIAIIHCSMQ